MANSLLQHDLEVVVIVFSILSALSSLSVISTFLFFPLMRKRVFMHIIFLVSVSDLMASIAATWGYPDQGTTLCAIQSFFISFFIKATMLWNLALCYQLYAVVMTGMCGIFNIYFILLAVVS